MKTKKTCLLVTAITATVAMALVLIALLVVAFSSREIFTEIYNILLTDTSTPDVYLTPQDAFDLTYFSMTIVFVVLGWELLVSALICILGYITYARIGVERPCTALLVLLLVASILSGCILWVVLVIVAMVTKSDQAKLASVNTSDQSDQISKLRKMRDEGVITEEEYVDMLTRIVK